ncbi:MAG: ribonuclease Z [Myxococcales bacterium]|nr:ribonuclease Z [Myxococcales bacterium]
MSVREMVVLGTASQVPTRHRNHNGYLLLFDGRGILFDPGEGTQRQMIHAEVSASMITRICITHFHGDHCLGLAGMIQRISLDGVPHEVPVHYPASGQAYFDRLRRASIFKDVSRIAPQPIREAGTLHSDDVLTLTTAKLSHTVESWGYRIDEPDGRTMLPEALAEAGVRGRAIGELVRQGEIRIDDRVVTLDDVSVHRKGQSVAFVMDTRVCDAAVQLAEGVDLLVCESTYLSDASTEARERGHMTAADAARTARDAGARRLLLTHFSQRYPRVEAFLQEARRIHDDCVAARDGARVPVPRRK